MPAGPKRGLPLKALARIAKICVCILAGLVVIVFAQTFLIGNLQILLPSLAAIAVFLYFSFRLKSQIQDDIFGEIGFLYLAFAVAYTVFPAFSFLTLSSISSGVGVPILESLLPGQGELGLQLWRQVLFIAAIAGGYLLFRGRRAPRFNSFDTLGVAEKPIIYFLFAGIVVSIVALWWLAAPVSEYIDYYTRYDHLPWIGLRVVAICTFVKTGGTFVLLPILFRNYERYRLYIWFIVLLRTVQEVLGSFGARIDAFMILLTAVVLYHYCVKRISLRKGLLVTLALGLGFAVIALVRSAGADSLAVGQAAISGRGVPVGELMALFVPGFHLYAERSMGSLPPVPWQLFFNDFITIIPFVGDTKWDPMYWYAANYVPDAAVPPLTLGPIALSALWGGEIGLFVEGFISGTLFAFLMRWFARDGVRWRVMAVYVFCYSTCVMCLKHSIFWHVTPLLRTILPVVVIVSVLARGFPESANLARVARGTGPLLPSE